MTFDTRMARATSLMKMNGIATGNVVTNTQKNTASPPSQSVLDNQGRDGGSGNNTVRLLRGCGSARGPQRANVASPFAQAIHEIEDAVDDAPGDIAPERTD